MAESGIREITEVEVSRNQPQKTYLGFAVFIIVISVVVLAILFSNPESRATHLSFQSSKGDWSDTAYPAFGRDFESVVLSFELYKIQCGAQDARLERITPKPSWYAPESWFNDYSEPHWRIPYAEPSPYAAIGNFPPPQIEHCANTLVSADDFEKALQEAQRYISSLSR